MPRKLIPAAELAEFVYSPTVLPSNASASNVVSRVPSSG